MAAGSVVVPAVGAGLLASAAIGSFTSTALVLSRSFRCNTSSPATSPGQSPSNFITVFSTRILPSAVTLTLLSGDNSNGSYGSEKKSASSFASPGSNSMTSFLSSSTASPPHQALAEDLASLGLGSFFCHCLSTLAEADSLAAWPSANLMLTSWSRGTHCFAHSSHPTLPEISAWPSGASAAIVNGTSNTVSS